MRTKTFFSNKKNATQAAGELIKKADASIDFDPDLVFFYATLKYNGHYQEMLDIIKKRFEGIPQIGASIDGMIFPHDMRTDGAVLVLGEDKNARIEVKSVNEEGALQSAQTLAKMIKCEKGVVILHFPFVHVPGLKKSAEFYATGKYYSAKAKMGDEEYKKKVARNFSNYCDRSKTFYFLPNVLEIVAKELGYNVPVIGVNVLHLQAKLNSPSIFSNFKDIEDGIAALVIEKDDVEVIYEDIYPEKGNSINETMSAIKNNFDVVKEFNALFEGNVLISLDGKPPVKAFKDVIGNNNNVELELNEKFNKENFQIQTPYFLSFFNEKTQGFMQIGIDSYFPFDLFPIMVDIDDFSNTLLLAHEPTYGQMYNYISGLYLIKNTDLFHFFCIDVGTISSFGDKAIDFQIEIEKKFNDNYIGLMITSPSIFLPESMKKKSNITEIKNNIYWSSCGTNIFCSI